MSAATTPVAPPGPLFRTVSVYVKSWPNATGLALLARVSARSAEPVDGEGTATAAENSDVLPDGSVAVAVRY